MSKYSLYEHTLFRYVQFQIQKFWYEYANFRFKIISLGVVWLDFGHRLIINRMNLHFLLPFYEEKWRRNGKKELLDSFRTEYSTQEAAYCSCSERTRASSIISSCFWLTGNQADNSRSQRLHNRWKRKQNIPFFSHVFYMYVLYIVNK